MAKEELSKEELLKIIERQKKVITNFEAVSSFYRYTRKLPLLGKTVKMTAGVLKSGQGRATKVVDNVRSEKPSLLAVCHPNFRGVRSATYALTSDVVEVSEVYSQKDARKIASKILTHNPQKILLSGYPIGYDLLAEEIKKQNQQARIFLFVHSAFLWFDVYPEENKVFSRMLELQKDGIIERTGFCKRDLAEYFKERGYKTTFVMNRFEIKEKVHKLSKKKAKIGIWGANLWHRNILNQVIAALMIPNTEVHVNEIGDFDFLDRTRVVVHGFLPKEEFDKLSAEMDINLYVSMTDCFPMTLIESMENGIPAIASDTSDVYAFDKKLKDSLTVSTIDGPIGISKKIEEVLENYGEIQKEIRNYLPILKEKVEKSIEEFLK